MKKTILIAALFIGLLITSSGFNKTSLNTSIGKMAPALSSVEIDDAIKKSEDEGKYVLLSFWSASDGASRLTTNDYDSWLSKNDSGNIELLAVNFDKSEKLFKEIVKRDGLDDSRQFNVSGNLARHIKDEYHLDDGYGSILIDPDGMIVAHNPSTNELSKYSQTML